jgi:hypothetical protein
MQMELCNEIYLETTTTQKKTGLKAKDKLAESNDPRKEEIAFVRPLQDKITNRETE